jgi:L-alanine-DL-glutamate epimerase-like enolase superfamily enzyme
MLDRAAIIALIGRIRRAMPGNADVMVDAAPAWVGGKGG